ncbi:MAG: AMP-binding protein [Chitinophagales bacterium]
MKDFNTIKIAGKIWSRQELQEEIRKAHWEVEYWKDFWSLIAQLINQKEHIIVQSSGSTGKPKQIEIAKEKLLASAAMTCQYFNLNSEKTALLCLSTKHIGGIMMVVRAFYSGLNLLVEKASANPLKNIQEPIDFVSMVPYQAQACLAEDAEKLAQIDTVLIGGGTVQKQLEESLVSHGVHAFSSFGMTESISHFAVREIGKEDFYQCLEGITIELSQRGTLILIAPKLLDNKLESNDLIEIVGNNKFTWLGRSDFAIESGGLKMHPELIERVLERHFKERIIISSLPSVRFTNEVILIVEGTERKVDKKIFEELEAYERPKHIFFMRSFIESNSKINRIKTREALTNLIKQKR